VLKKNFHLPYTYRTRLISAMNSSSDESSDAAGPARRSHGFGGSMVVFFMIHHV
jgi:hypothetical protein